MSEMRSRTSRLMSTHVSVVISPATTTRPVVISVSHATRPCGSSRSTASSTESEIWSAILSGWPSVTDSDVKRNSRAAIEAETLLDRDELGEPQPAVVLGHRDDGGPERAEVRAHLRRDAGVVREAEQQRDPGLQIQVQERDHVVRRRRGAERLLVDRIARELRAAGAEGTDPATRVR